MPVVAELVAVAVVARVAREALAALEARVRPLRRVRHQVAQQVRLLLVVLAADRTLRRDDERPSITHDYRGARSLGKPSTITRFLEEPIAITRFLEEPIAIRVSGVIVYNRLRHLLRSRLRLQGLIAITRFNRLQGVIDYKV